MSVTHVASCDLPVTIASNTVQARLYAALVFGTPTNGCLVRVHSECLTGDVLGAENCDCGRQLKFVLREIVKHESGILLYMRGHGGRGNGLGNKVRTLYLYDREGMNTVSSHRALSLTLDNRSFDVAVSIVKDHFELSEITLLSDNPEKVAAFGQSGIDGRQLDTTVQEMSHIPYG